MKINNIGECKTYFINTKLDSLDASIADFVACVTQYGLLCSCKKIQKFQKHEQCVQQYINVVSNVLPKYKDYIFDHTLENTISFYNQTYHIHTLSR